MPGKSYRPTNPVFRARRIAPVVLLGLGIPVVAAFGAGKLGLFPRGEMVTRANASAGLPFASSDDVMQSMQRPPQVIVVEQMSAPEPDVRVPDVQTPTRPSPIVRAEKKRVVARAGSISIGGHDAKAIRPGTRVACVLDTDIDTSIRQPVTLTVNRHGVLPLGTKLAGRVSQVSKSGRVGIEIVSVITPDGDVLDARGYILDASGAPGLRGVTTRDYGGLVASVGTSIVAGAMIGAFGRPNDGDRFSDLLAAGTVREGARATSNAVDDIAREQPTVQVAAASTCIAEFIDG